MKMGKKEGRGGKRKMGRQAERREEKKREI
jgi:hypothetical protein